VFAWQAVAVGGSGRRGARLWRPLAPVRRGTQFTVAAQPAPAHQALLGRSLMRGASASTGRAAPVGGVMTGERRRLVTGRAAAPIGIGDTRAGSNNGPPP